MTTFSADARKALASSGQALPDGGYPIRNVVDLQHAIRATYRSGNAARISQVKAHIKKRAKALKREILVPDDW